MKKISNLKRVFFFAPTIITLGLVTIVSIILVDNLFLGFEVQVVILATFVSGILLIQERNIRYVGLIIGLVLGIYWLYNGVNNMSKTYIELRVGISLTVYYTLMALYISVLSIIKRK